MKVITLADTKKKEVVETIKRELEKRDEITFAYIHGSFLFGNFRDIDIAIYLGDNIGKTVHYELQLEVELGKLIGLPVDVRVLNSAPLSFRFNAIRGLLLFSRDERARTDFEASTISEYHDFAYFRKRYRREVLGI
jgi:predicted nucleotidyltransferase